MKLNPLSYAPQGVFGRLVDWLRRRISEMKRMMYGIPVYTDAQWCEYRTLMARSVLARRIYFLIATGSSQDRTAASVAASITRWNKVIDPDSSNVVSEEDAHDALLELYCHGLIDEANRPRSMYDLAV